MDQKKFSLIIDAGNTRIKAALFEGPEPKEIRSFSKMQFGELKSFIQQFQHLPAIIASVMSDKDTKWLQQLIGHAILFRPGMPVPIQMGYDTPETLGADRLCNAIAGFHKTGKATLIADFGTCIKYDFVDGDGVYQGGAISPGLEMRFKAMHTFTGKLPLIDETDKTEVLGKNTKDAMRSGVMNGIFFEAEGFIKDYCNKNNDLQVILTGGDAQNFDFGHINGIFADENLTLKGLQLTLAYHDS